MLALVMQAIRPLPTAHPHLVRLRESVEGALEGKSDVVELALIALLAGGHLLIEDVPGVGKTTLARAIARAVGGEVRRVQFTSDLMPSDILGVSVYDQRRAEFTFRPGPVFANVLLADEINRASPRTQSALLEAMNEGHVSIDGQTLPLPEPFFVVATQNANDFAGTFPLPESQLDRFMLRIRIGYPSPQTESNLIRRALRDPVEDVPLALEASHLVALQRQVARIAIEDSLVAYILAIVTATRSAPSVSLGLSPRAARAFSLAVRARAMLRGRAFVIPDDVAELAVPALAHRIRVTAYAEGFAVGRDEAETAIRDIVARIPQPT